MKRLDVYLTTNTATDPSSPDENERGRLVGTLVEVEHRVYFEYDARFLEDPLWLSPFKLPPEPGLHEHRDLAFGPLFGLFDDSLPDGWGLLLMDRHFRGQGVALETVSPLDRLAYLGTRTMTVAREGCDPRMDHILRIADAAGVEKKKAQGIIEEVSAATADWPRFARASDVDPTRARRIQETFPGL